MYDSVTIQRAWDRGYHFGIGREKWEWGRGKDELDRQGILGDIAGLDDRKLKYLANVFENGFEQARVDRHNNVKRNYMIG